MCVPATASSFFRVVEYATTTDMFLRVFTVNNIRNYASPSDVVGRLTPSINGNQEFTAPRSLVSQAGPSHWDVCTC
jgi:hypothetical protein